LGKYRTHAPTLLGHGCYFVCSNYLVGNSIGMSENENKLQNQIDALNFRIIKLEATIEAYRNAQGQVVNLAFSLIAGAVVSVVIATVVKK